MGTVTSISVNSITVETTSKKTVTVTQADRPAKAPSTP